LIHDPIATPRLRIVPGIHKKLSLCTKSINNIKRGDAIPVATISTTRRTFLACSIEMRPSGAKARIDFAAFAARLKPCPLKTSTQVEVP